MAETFTKVMKQFPWKLDMKHYGKFSIYEINRHVLARVQLVEEVSYQYSALRVTIINKASGKVDEATFPFDEHMHTRSDTRKDHVGSFYVWANKGEADWYTAVPDKKSYDTYVSAVESYILEFDTGAIDK